MMADSLECESRLRLEMEAVVINVNFDSTAKTPKIL
jgi:hypothetical protein